MRERTSLEGYRELVRSWVFFPVPEDLVEEVWKMEEGEARRFYHFFGGR